MSTKKSHGLLEGKTGIVFGPLDETSLGWHIAEAAYREGARLAISNVAIARRIGKVDQLAKLCGDAPVIVCDASNDKELETGFHELLSVLGQVDFIVHSIGMSQNIRKGHLYDEINHDWYQRTLDVSAVSLHRIIDAAIKKEAIRNGGSIISLTYIAGQRAFSEYSDMGDAKALLESITRSYGVPLARRGIRINTVSQSPTWTRAGSGIPNFDKMFEYSEHQSPLGNASGEECGDYVVTLLSDYTKKVTMQNLYHDGGFSTMGPRLSLLNVLHAALRDPDFMQKHGLTDQFTDLLAHIQRLETQDGTT